ncbi:MAG: hypothetical protein AAF804_03595, partial [Bacteroidota bacterium]
MHALNLFAFKAKERGRNRFVLLGRDFPGLAGMFHVRIEDSGLPEDKEEKPSIASYARLFLTQDSCKRSTKSVKLF